MYQLAYFNSHNQSTLQGVCLKPWKFITKVINLFFEDVRVIGAGSTASILKWIRQLGSGVAAFTMIGDAVQMSDIKKKKEKKGRKHKDKYCDNSQT